MNEVAVFVKGDGVRSKCPAVLAHLFLVPLNDCGSELAINDVGAEVLRRDFRGNWVFHG